MTCTGGGQSASSSVTVVFTNDPPAISLTASSPQEEIFPDTVINSAGTPDLTWTSNVSGCFISSADPTTSSRVIDMQGQYPAGFAADVANVAGHYVYTLRCGSLQATRGDRLGYCTSGRNARGTDLHLVANLPYMLTWTTNTLPCTGTGGSTGDGWAGAKNSVGAQTFAETAPGSYIFTLACGTGTSAAQSQVTVTVPAAAVSISANANNAFTNQVTTLTWSSTLAPCTSIDGSGGRELGRRPGNPTGSMILVQNNPGTFTYAITCGTGAQAVASVHAGRRHPRSSDRDLGQRYTSPG